MIPKIIIQATPYSHYMQNTDKPRPDLEITNTELRDPTDDFCMYITLNHIPRVGEIIKVCPAALGVPKELEKDYLELTNMLADTPYPADSMFVFVVKEVAYIPLVNGNSTVGLVCKYCTNIEFKLIKADI